MAHGDYFRLPLTINEALKWLTPLPITMQDSLWWWQCRFVYRTYPPPPPQVSPGRLLGDNSVFNKSNNISECVGHFMQLFVLRGSAGRCPCGELYDDQFITTHMCDSYVSSPPPTAGEHVVRVFATLVLRLVQATLWTRKVLWGLKKKIFFKALYINSHSFIRSFIHTFVIKTDADWN